MDQISMLFEKFNITIHSSNSFLIELLAHNIKVVGLPSIIALSIISSDFGWSVFFPLLIWKRWLELLLKRWRSFSKKICWAMMQASKLAIFHRIDWDSSIDEVFLDGGLDFHAAKHQWAYTCRLWTPLLSFHQLDLSNKINFTTC